MKSISFFILFISFGFIYSDSKKSKNPEKKTQISKKEKSNFKAEYKVLNDNKIKIVLPFESGFRKDLYDSNGNLLQSDYLDIDGHLVEIEPRIAIEKRIYNSSGFLEQLQALDENKNPSSLTSYVYDQDCLQIKKDDSCATEISLTDGMNNRLENEEGIYKYTIEFDHTCLQNTNKKASDCKKLETRLNKKMNLVEDKDGNAKILRTFDPFGNLSLYEIYDSFDKIIHKVIYAYDYKCIELTNKPQGCIILQQYANRIENTKNKTDTETLNYGKKFLTYDINCIQEKNNSEKCISLEENYDLNGKLQDIVHSFTFGCMDYCLELGAYAKKISKFDLKGNEVLREFYNSKNELIEDSSGGAKYVYTYNQECLDNGYKTQHCRTITEIYDKNLKLTYKAIYDENCVKTGKASMEESNYCTAWKESYDTVRLKGKLKNKIRIIKADFDSNGFKTSMEKYNINRKLSLRTVYSFDREKLIKKENQDAHGNLVEDSEGIATYLYQYGTEKYSIKEETLGKDGKLKENRDGIARMIFAYDSNCLKKISNRYECSTLEEFYNSKEVLAEPKTNIENTPNYAKLIREFDAEGNLILEAYFNKKNKPKKNQKGITKYKYSYDEKGDMLEEEHYGKKDKLKQKILYTYDPECKVLSKDFSCNTSIVHLNQKKQLLDKEKLEGVPYAKEITSYNHTCIKTISDPDECIEKKEYINSKNEIIYAEYFQYSNPPSPKSEIKFIKLKMNQNKTLFSAEFIK